MKHKILFILPVSCLAIIFLQNLFVNENEKTLNISEPFFENLLITDVSKSSEDTKISEERRKRDEDILYTLISLQTNLKTLDLNPLLNQIKTPNNISELEVKNSVHVALILKESGKTEKALKIMEHAVNIAPNNPDVLNYYGEILEITENDLISADQLYFRALSFDPDHAKALSNRERTVHIVEQLDLLILKNIDHKRNLLKNLINFDGIFQKFKKQSYYLHIYHTVGIEGNTMTIEQLIYLLETGNVVSGKSIVEHNEILGLQLAMKYIKLLTRIKRIEMKEILGIHRRIMGHVDPLSSGSFRTKQVYVGSHTPPEPKKILPLFNEFIHWLNSEEASNMHPIRYAALAHYKLVDIHPFADGNGRTSRLLMNLILIRAGYPPVIILKEHRQHYYDYLKLANKGDVRPFVRFVAQCTEQVLDLYLWGAQKYSEAKLEDMSEKAVSI